MYFIKILICISAIEIVGASKRLIPIQVITLTNVGGELMLALVAYLIRDWKKLQLTMSCIFATILLYWW